MSYGAGGFTPSPVIQPFDLLILKYSNSLVAISQIGQVVAELAIGTDDAPFVKSAIKEFITNFGTSARIVLTGDFNFATACDISALTQIILIQVLGNITYTSSGSWIVNSTTYVTGCITMPSKYNPGANAALPPSNVQMTQPSNPSGATVAGYTNRVMMGLGITFTPKYSGKLKITIKCGISNNTANDGAIVEGDYGTGSAPVNGAAITGSICAPNAQINVFVASAIESATLIGVITGLTVGSQYWFDCSLAPLIGGTATISSIVYTIEEFLS
jgi:hypothetical protein